MVDIADEIWERMSDEAKKETDRREIWEEVELILEDYEDYDYDERAIFRKILDKSKSYNATDNPTHIARITREVCPECNSSKIKKEEQWVGGVQGTSKFYRCINCDATFWEPKKDIDRTVEFETNPACGCIDYGRSKEFARGCKNKDCYRNALIASSQIPDAKYVEGWVLVRLDAASKDYFPMAFNHAWIEDGDTIIDPTPTFTEDRGNMYFPAVKFTVKEAVDLVAANKGMLPIINYEWFHPKMPYAAEMLAAKEEAEKFLFGQTLRDIIAKKKPNPGRRWSKPSKVQAVIFDKVDWSVPDAKEWLRTHGFKYGKVHETPKEIRFRQFSPKMFKEFRSMSFGEGRGIRALVAEPNPARKRALITWIPGTEKFKVVVMEGRAISKHTFEGEQGLTDGLWNIWSGFFQNDDKSQGLCPITTEWKAPNPYFGENKLKYDVPPTKKAPRRRFLHKCPPVSKGKRRVDAEGLKMLDECISRLKQTKTIHTIEGEYTPERKALHDNIIHHIFDGVECITNTPPVAILTGGPPGAGKSTYAKMKFPWSDREKVKGILHIDADYIRSMLPEYEGWNADATHAETQDILKTVLGRIGTPCKTDIFYDGTMNSQKKYDELIAKLKSMGYFVYMIFVDITPEKSVKRVRERYVRGGRWVPASVVDEANKNALTSFKNLRAQVDGWIRVDGNSTDRKFKRIGSGGDQLPTTRPYWTGTMEE